MGIARTFPALVQSPSVNLSPGRSSSFRPILPGGIGPSAERAAVDKGWTRTFPALVSLTLGFARTVPALVQIPLPSEPHGLWYGPLGMPELSQLWCIPKRRQLLAIFKGGFGLKGGLARTFPALVQPLSVTDVSRSVV